MQILGTLFLSANTTRLKSISKKGLVISTKIGYEEGEAANLSNLGTAFSIVGDYDASEVHLEKALSISRDIGDRRKEFQILRSYTTLYLSQNKTPFRVFICALKSMRSWDISWAPMISSKHHFWRIKNISLQAALSFAL